MVAAVERGRDLCGACITSLPLYFTEFTSNFTTIGVERCGAAAERGRDLCE